MQAYINLYLRMFLKVPIPNVGALLRFRHHRQRAPSIACLSQRDTNRLTAVLCITLVGVRQRRGDGHALWTKREARAPPL